MINEVMSSSNPLAVSKLLFDDDEASPHIENKKSRNLRKLAFTISAFCFLHDLINHKKKRPKTLLNKVLSPPGVGRRGLEPRTP